MIRLPAIASCNEVNLILLANEWTEFGNCSKICGRGYRYRYATCGNETCEGDQFKENSEKCNTWNKTACPSKAHHS